MTIKRRKFLGATTFGAAAAVVSVRASNQYGNDYEVIVRPPAAFGLGRGDAASLSVVWMPGKRRQQPPLKAWLALYDLGGKVLVEKSVELAPFNGEVIDYEPPAGNKRQQVFGYVFIDGLTTKVASELFGGLEIYDMSSGRANVAAAPIVLG